MLAPLSWLRDYAPFDQPVPVLSDALSDLGLVVDGVQPVNAEIPGVVVARILDIRAHPDADRIRLVDVDAGDGEPLQIACGAWNMAVGDLVPLAGVGAVLPGGMEIARRKMRGQWSNGMLCSPQEIGRPEVAGVDGLLILPPGLAVPGTPIGEAFGGPDAVFDLDVPANRPDALCMAGVARDLAASLGLPFTYPASVPGGSVAPPAVDPGVERASVDVLAADLCARFTGTVITGVTVGPSPGWLAERLALAGMRPINVVVDVSNYVMLDVGQPNHAYDLDHLGGRGLVVRRARAGEELTTLDGVARRFTTDDLLICDAESVPVGAAGIMGGADAEISESTTSILLEAAWFAPLAVARTGQRLGLGSEARHRFERGVDPEVAPAAVARFAQLLVAASGGAGDALALGPSVDVRSDADLPAPVTVTVRPARVNAVLGTDLAADAVAELLRPLGFTVADGGAGSLAVTVPTWRPDTGREIDVIEEVGRLHGYRRIARSLPGGVRRGGLSSYQRDRRRARELLAGAGLDEAWTTTFLAPDDIARAGLPGPPVRITNPLDQSESVLRTELLPGLLRAARFNADRQQPSVGLFEVGRVFASPAAGGETLPVETERLAVLVSGPDAGAPSAVRAWAALSGGFALAGAGLVASTHPGMHPTRTASIVGATGTLIGAAGEVDPDVVAAFGLSGRVAYLTADLGLLLAEPRRSRQARPISRYPASDVDLAFVVAEEIPAGAVAVTLRTAGGALLEALHLFDVYRDASRIGEGRRSLAFRLRFRAPDRTLTDAEIASLREGAVAATVSTHGAELRA